MKRAVALGVLLFGMAGWVACRTPLTQDPLGAADPRPGRMVAALAERSGPPAALRARARVAIEAPDLRLRRPQRLALARPGRLRVEVLGLFGQVAAILVVRDSQYQLYEAGRSQISEGILSPALLWQVARVDLEAEDAVNLLLGTPRPLPGLVVTGAWSRGDGSLGFTRVDERGQARERYVFDGQGRLEELERSDAGGRRIWRARFSDYRPVSSPESLPDEFAFQVQLDFPRVDGRAKLDFQQVDLAADLPDELFILQAPGRAADAPEKAAP